MKRYEKPEITIIKFEVEDVIAASSPSIDGGSTSFPGSWLNTDVDGGSTNFLEEWLQS